MTFDAVAAVREDLAKGFQDAFTLEPSTIQFAPLLHEPPMSNDRYTATVWSVPAKHTGRFVGLEPTQREIVIHGVTIVQLPRGEDQPMFQRLIDWSHVLGQLGVTMNGRPVAAEPA